MIKWLDRENNAAFVAPERASNHRKAYFYLPVLREKRVGFHPLEFFRVGEAQETLPDIRCIFEEKPEFFGSFASRLFELELKHVFGVRCYTIATCK
ncbi:MAG: hypothetical protein AAGA48_09845 [Myxococcota bacterium]